MIKSQPFHIELFQMILPSTSVLIGMLAGTIWDGFNKETGLISPLACALVGMSLALFVSAPKARQARVTAIVLAIATMLLTAFTLWIVEGDRLFVG